MTFTWRALPDPRDPQAPQGAECRIQASDHALRHLADKHVASPDEPWDRWLPAELRERICRLVADPKPAAEEIEATWRALSDHLEDQAGWCLGAPLVVRVSARYPDQEARNAVEKWILLLPVGAILAVIVRPRAVFLATCFFETIIAGPDDASTRCKRWQDHFRQRYGSVGPAGICPRGPEDEVSIRGEKSGTRETPDVPVREIHRLIGFVTWTHWGFRETPPHPMIRPQVGYTFPPEAYPAGSQPGAKAIQPKSNVYRRSSPRRRDEDEEL